MLEIECGYSLSSDSGIAQNELRSFWTSMIYNGEYHIETLRWGKVGDQIHRHHLEGSRMGVRDDRLERGFSMSGAWFILLTCGASLNIFFGKVFHLFPLIGLTKEMYGVGNTGMSCEGMVVIQL